MYTSYVAYHAYTFFTTMCKAVKIPEENTMDGCDRRVNDKRESHHVMKRKCILCFFFFPTIFGSMENHKIQTFTFLPLFPQQHLLSPQRAPERLLQLAQDNLDTLVTEMDELLTRVSL